MAPHCLWSQVQATLPDTEYPPSEDLALLVLPSALPSAKTVPEFLPCVSTLQVPSQIPLPPGSRP